MALNPVSLAEIHLIQLISLHAFLPCTDNRAGFLGAAVSCWQHRTNALEEATSLLKISLIQRLDERGLFILYDKIKIQKLSDLDRIM